VLKKRKAAKKASSRKPKIKKAAKKPLRRKTGGDTLPPKSR